MLSRIQRPIFIAAAAVIAALTLIGATRALHAQTTLPAGTSVVGLGLLPGYPELFIHDSAGNDVQQIIVGQAPNIYGANYPTLNSRNACLLDDNAGIADVGAAPAFQNISRNHAYTFTFADGFSVGRFSFVL